MTSVAEAAQVFMAAVREQLDDLVSHPNRGVLVSWRAFMSDLKEWNQAAEERAEAAKQYTDTAAKLVEIDSRLAVHLQHREINIDQSGASQLRGTFRSARRVLALGALLTGLGATLYAFGLPSDQVPPEDTNNLIRFTPGLVEASSGAGVKIRIIGLVGELGEACDGDLDGVLVGGAGEASEVVIGDTAPLSCQGRWVLPAGSWYEVSGRALPAPPDSPEHSAAQQASGPTGSG